jgi:hypothetical protein
MPSLGGGSKAQNPKIILMASFCSYTTQPTSFPSILHTHCGKECYDAFLSTQLLKHTRWILEQTTNSETVDTEGMRPLYLASMISEYFMKELLAFSTDPAGRILEGLSILQLVVERATW